MTAQQYVLTLENGTTATIELEHMSGGTTWQHKILHGTPPFHHAWHDTFGECFRVACLRVEERCGSPVVQCELLSRAESLPSASELEAIVRDLAAVQRWVDFGEGRFKCPFCSVEPEGDIENVQHETDCVWLRARKALGMDRA